MNFEWDQRKNQMNFEKHGIYFDEAIEIFSNIHITGKDTRKNYGEIREITIGAIDDELILVLIVVHTQRKQKTRIISARKANKKEKGLYYEHIKKKN